MCSFRIDPSLFSGANVFTSLLGQLDGESDIDQLMVRLFDQVGKRDELYVNPQLLRPENDLRFIESFPKRVVEGFLNLGESDGWGTGGPAELGLAFTRQLVRGYIAKRVELHGKNTAMLTRVLNTFKSLIPDKSRSSFDPSVTGWKGHVVSRLVGNLASSYRASAPFFEVLINSVRYDKDQAVSCPFAVRIMATGEALEARRQQLTLLKAEPAKSALARFYQSGDFEALAFLETYGDKLGPNSSRILNALDHLSRKQLPTQSVGNCWIKQPMRVLLAALYLEIVSEHHTMSYDCAWSNAVRFYKQMQKEAEPLMKKLIQRSKVDESAKKIALAALERRMKL